MIVRWMCLAMLTGLAATAGAQAPAGIGYQGLALDPMGAPLNGTIDVDLSLWADPISTDPADLRFSELHSGVTVTDGVFDVALGQGTGGGTLDASVFEVPDRWLEVSIDGELLSPRQRLWSLAYAFVAQTCGDAETLGGLSVGEIVLQAQTGVVAPATFDAHAADPAAHHTPYTDGDAVAAVLAADGPGSGLDADTVDGQPAAAFTSIAQLITHEALSSAHHVRYSDAEAVAAAVAAGEFVPLGGGAMTGQLTIDPPGNALVARGDVFVGGGATNFDGGTEVANVEARSATWSVGVQNEASVADTGFFIGTSATDESLFHIERDGDVGIGTSEPQVPLHVVGGSDVTLGSGGYLITGGTGGRNLAVDDNEIQARDNGAPSTLTLNNEGGTVLVGGALSLTQTATYTLDVSETLPPLTECSDEVTTAPHTFCALTAVEWQAGAPGSGTLDHGCVVEPSGSSSTWKLRARATTTPVPFVLCRVRCVATCF